MRGVKETVGPLRSGAGLALFAGTKSRRIPPVRGLCALATERDPPLEAAYEVRYKFAAMYFVLRISSLVDRPAVVLSYTIHLSLSCRMRNKFITALPLSYEYHHLQIL